MAAHSRPSLCVNSAVFLCVEKQKKVQFPASWIGTKDNNCQDKLVQLVQCRVRIFSYKAFHPILYRPFIDVH